MLNSIIKFAFDFVQAMFLALLIGGPFFYYMLFMMKP